MEEMLDVFDVKGNFLGVQPRNCCHGQNVGFYHKHVWIWIVNSEGKILLQKRAKTKKNNPGKYDMPSAGHVATGESYLSACVRETSEELGVNVNENDFELLKEFIKQKSWGFVRVYLLRKDIDVEKIDLQIEEVESVEWVSYDEFVKLLFSDKFSDHTQDYKEWICEKMKEYSK